jgi:hypothetical protein
VSAVSVLLTALFVAGTYEFRVFASRSRLIEAFSVSAGKPDQLIETSRAVSDIS